MRENKAKKGNRVKRITILNRVAWEGLTERGMFEENSENEGTSHVTSSRWEGPEAYKVQCVKSSSGKPEGLDGVSGENVLGG